ncbi:hypothetical protein [Streptomyces sp. NPDC007904]|uniref:hypothetical protein n=1 Tax=Streptomyces sp. NPDC007904 TaxID=3364787 RepID=UPI0036E4F6F5
MQTTSGVEGAVMPRQVRAAQLLLYAMAFAGMVVVLALSGRLTAYGLGELMAPWLWVWGCAALATTYGGRARNGARLTTVALMVLVVLPSFPAVANAATAGEFVDAALHIALGAPVVVLLFLPETTAWFDRAG